MSGKDAEQEGSPLLWRECERKPSEDRGDFPLRLLYVKHTSCLPTTSLLASFLMNIFSVTLLAQTSLLKLFVKTYLLLK